MKNKRTAVAGISVLGAIGVISTGFAGWVITAPAQSGSGEGTITADGNVETKGYVQIKSATMTDDKICYAASSGTNPVYNWLSSDNKKADLYAELTVTLTLGDKVNQLDFTNIIISEKNSGTQYTTALTNGIVGTLPVLKSSDEEANSTTGYVRVTGPDSSTTYTYGDDGKSVSLKGFTVTTDVKVVFGIHFAWGEKFGGKNPFDYYNGKEWTADLQKEAGDYIKKLDALNNAAFQIGFTVAGSETATQA